jgi:hypothetical protein
MYTCTGKTTVGDRNVHLGNFISEKDRDVDFVHPCDTII